MIKLVTLRSNDISFYVKMRIGIEFGIPSVHWTGVDDGKIYHSDELYFLQEQDNLINNI